MRKNITTNQKFPKYYLIICTILLIICFGIILITIRTLFTIISDKDIKIATKFNSPLSKTGGIQEAIDSLPQSGGIVYIPPGIYTLKASIHLRDNIAIIGAGASTILKPVNETKTKLIYNAEIEQRQITVESASKFEKGMDIMIRDDNHRGGNALYRKIIAIQNNTIILDPELINAYTTTSNAMIINVFPIIIVNNSSNILIKNLKIDGNKSNVGNYEWTQAGIFFIRVSNSTIENVQIINSNGEGISDQGENIDAFNKIINNIIWGSAGNGIHLGTRISHDIVTGNIVRDNEGDGLYFCVKVRDSIISNNIFSGNRGHGIGGLGYDTEADDDRYNLIENNEIKGNYKHGISAVNNSENNIINNVITNNSKELAGKYNGIYLKDVKNTIIANNRCYDDQDIKTQKCGIEKQGGDNNIIEGNFLKENIQSASCLLLETNDVFVNNLIQ